MPPKDEEIKDLLTKSLTGLLGVCVAVALGLGTFALKESVSAQLSIRELNVRMLAVEQSVELNRVQQATMAESLYATKLSDQRLSRVEQDMQEIKLDIRALLKRP